MKTTAKTNVRDWYVETYPHDTLAQSIAENITFEDVFETLDRRKDVYRLLGITDSMIRENVFSELATIMEVDYDYIYEQWLLCEDEDEEIILPSKILKNQITMTKVVCSVCGSEDVQTKVWTKPNENFERTCDFIDELIAEPADCWCCQCEENQKLIIVDKDDESEEKLYICPECQEEALRYAMIDLDGTNLEEGYSCGECGANFIGLDNESVIETNPEITEKDE